MSRKTLPSETEERILLLTRKECYNQSPRSTSAQWNEDELLVMNLPTSNPFSPLQESPRKPPGNSKLDESKENPPHNTVTPTDNNNTRSKVIFLCDSNGKFLDTKHMFSSKQEVTYVRAPLIEPARNYLQNEIRTPPQMILLHIEAQTTLKEPIPLKSLPRTIFSYDYRGFNEIPIKQDIVLNSCSSQRHPNANNHVNK